MAQLVTITGIEAERRLRCKLDKRKRYAVYRRKVHELIQWTDDCSDCTDYGDYGSRRGPFGCKRCGYTGKCRRREWVPVTEYPTRKREAVSNGND